MAESQILRPAPRGRWPRPLRIIVPLLLLAAVVLAVLWALGVWKPVRSTTIAASGIIEARVIEVGTDVEGVVVSRPVEKGQMVKRGQLIAEVAKEISSAQFLQAQAAADAAQKKVTEADDAVRLQTGVTTAQVAQAQAATGTAAARSADVRAGSRRQEIGAAEDNARQAQAAAQAAREALRELQNGARPEEIREAEDAYQAATAAVATAQAQLADLQAGARAQDIRAAQAEVDKAQAGLTKALQDYSRAQQLFVNKAIAAQQLDAAQAARDAAQADVNAARQQLALLQAGSRPDQIKAAQSAVQQAQAEQRRADQALTLVRKGPREEDIARARAQLQQAENAAQAAEQQASLVRAGARPGQIEAANKQVGEAQAGLRQARAGQEQVAVAQAEAAAARAALAQAQAQVEVARAALDKYRVVAPTDGLVDDTHVHIGEVVKPGSSLVTMVDFSDTYVTVYVPEPELPRVKLGQAAQVSVDGRPGRPFTGKVRRISQQAEFTPKYVQTVQERTRTVFAVEIALENKEGILKPGMPADARIETGEAPPPSPLPALGSAEQGRGSETGAAGGGNR